MKKIYIGILFNIGTFLIWRQSHPIYYAELFYRQNPQDSVLNYFKDIVFETADFMASFPHYNDSAGEIPGFPKNGKWKVKWEGLKKMP